LRAALEVARKFAQVYPEPNYRRRRTIAVLLLAALASLSGALVAGGTGLLGNSANSQPADRPARAASGPPALDPFTAKVRREARRSADPAGARAGAEKEAAQRRRQRRRGPIEWRDSVAVGTHSAGELRRGVLLPAEGRRWVSWDPILKRRPNREGRRWGTDRLVRKTLRVLREFGAAHPKAPRVAIGDLSRPEGGDFGPQFGSIGHASHQNGLDADVYYPRKDDRVRPPERPSQVRLDWAQELVDRFVSEGAEKVFVGPSLELSGPPGVVVPLANHDNHLHFRLP
jgi:hypothetical protein